MRKVSTTSLARAAPPPVAVKDNLVMYVEDDHTNWEVANLGLRRRFDLLWAQNDREACELILTHHERLSAILMDIELRGSTLDGIQLTRLLRGIPGGCPIPEFAATVPVLRTPILFVTAYGARYSEPDLKAAGASRLLNKPVNFAELSLALSSLHLERMSTPASNVVRACGQRSVLLEALVAGLAPEFKARAAMILETGMFGPVKGEADRALVSLGVDGLRNLAVFLAVGEIRTQVAGDVLLECCTRRAAIAYQLALRFLPERTSACSVTGLLLESGLLLRAQHDMAGALEIGRSPARARPTRERVAGEGEHPQRGARMAEEWLLSGEIAEAVRHHHDAALPQGKLAQLAWATELLAGMFEPGDPREMHREALRALDAIGIDRDLVPDLLAGIPELTRVLATALGCERPIGPSFLDLLDERRPKDGELAQLSRAYHELVRTLDAVVTQKEALTSRLWTANERLSRLASTDQLTGLANRRTFDDVLYRDLALADRNEQPLSLLLLDADHFKRINDSHGHAVGDIVLQALASKLRGAVRASDLVARYGGEEFAVILPRTDIDGAKLLAERIRDGVARLEITSTPGGTPEIPAGLRVTISIGISTVRGPGCGDAAKTLVHRADQALYDAKSKGRNRIEVRSEPLGSSS